MAATAAWQAAIYATGKSRVALYGVRLTSQQGFGVWAVQRAHVRLGRGCVVHDCGRSGIVCFGRPSVRVRESTISNAAMHGICARGQSRVSVSDSRVVGAGVRGIYAYHNVTLELLGRTCVTGTRDPYGAAVQVEALRASDRATLLLGEGCGFEGNRGAGLTVRGNVLVQKPPPPHATAATLAGGGPRRAGGPAPHGHGTLNRTVR